MTSNNNKNVHKKRDRSTKAQKQYVRGLVHNLSLERLTDQEISDYLHTEKNIDLARITINGIRRSIEKQAEKWYIELRHSRYKYIASYKERIDSLLSYQKKLHQIIDFYIKPPDQMVETDTVIRAISELHKIEISIFSLWKQIPDLAIINGKNYSATSEETTPSEPRPTTYPTIPDPNNPGKWITDPAWIEENIKEMEKNSNLKDFDITRKS
jgi:hypothetical protein